MGRCRGARLEMAFYLPRSGHCPVNQLVIPVGTPVIFSFSLFTLLAAFASGVWSLAVWVRLLAGIGIGGEWGIETSMVSEDWPEERRTMGAALMHTGYYIGFFLAAAANYFIGSRFGWRYMFVVGGIPAIFIAWIQRTCASQRAGKTKPSSWEKDCRCEALFFVLFSPQYRKRTIVNSMFLIIVSLIGLSGWLPYIAPAAMTYIAERFGRTEMQVARLASYSTALLGIGTVVGALIVRFWPTGLGGVSP